MDDPISGGEYLILSAIVLKEIEHHPECYDYLDNLYHKLLHESQKPNKTYDDVIRYMNIRDKYSDDGLEHFVRDC